MNFISVMIMVYTAKLVFNVCFYISTGKSRGVIVNLLDYGLEVSEFERQPCYYVIFRTKTLGKRINPLIPPAMG